MSRALNGASVVTDETRERVLRAAERLQYTPHAGARSLSTRRTQTIGVLLPDVYGEFFSELLRGIDAAARASGLHLLVTGSHGDASEASAAIRAMTGRVDGLIVLSPYLESDGTLRPRVPVVLMNAREPSDEYPTLSVDNYGGAFAMATHLASLGYTRIAHVAGPADNFDAQERLRGYKDALAKQRPRLEPIVVPGEFNEDSGHAAGVRLLALEPRPEAIFAGNDMMAIGCLFALKDAGVAVPDEIALAGFDDIPIARYVTPALTTVHVDIADMGRRALDALMRTITGSTPRGPLATTLQAKVVLRASCGGRPDYSHKATGEMP